MVWKGVDLSKEMGMLFPDFENHPQKPMFKIIAVTDSFGHFA